MAGDKGAKKGAKKGSKKGAVTAPRITRADLEAKLSEIDAELSDTGEAVKPKAMAVGAGAVVLILVLAFVLGRRKGKLASTIVEVRRL